MIGGVYDYRQSTTADWYSFGPVVTSVSDTTFISYCPYLFNSPSGNELLEIERDIALFNAALFRAKKTPFFSCAREVEPLPEPSARPAPPPRHWSAGARMVHQRRAPHRASP
jgi:hypothetical protein